MLGEDRQPEPAWGRGLRGQEGFGRVCMGLHTAKDGKHGDMAHGLPEATEGGPPTALVILGVRGLAFL